MVSRLGGGLLSVSTRFARPYAGVYSICFSTVALVPGIGDVLILLLNYSLIVAQAQKAEYVHLPDDPRAGAENNLRRPGSLIGLKRRWPLIW